MRPLELVVIQVSRYCGMRKAKGIPTFIHESNSFAGKSNMMLGKKATKFLPALTEWKNFFQKKRSW